MANEFKKAKANEVKAVIGTVIGLFLLVVVLILFFTIWTTVPAGHYGIKDTFGQVSEDVLSSGFTFKSPFTSIRKFDGRTQKIMLDNVEGSDKAGQLVYADIVLNYRIKDKGSAKIIYKTIGSYKDYASILALDQKAQEGFKQATVKYEALEILDKKNLPLLY